MEPSASAVSASMLENEIYDEEPQCQNFDCFPGKYNSGASLNLRRALSIVKSLYQSKDSLSKDNVAIFLKRTHTTK